MRIALCVHGLPPELVGGTELTVQALTHALARAGDEVLVVSGSLRGRGELRIERETAADPESGARYQVVRVLRGDLYFDHWQKSQHTLVTRAFRELLREERIELVHVNHWMRLSDDLVLAAARERVPAVVTLHDHFADCLLVARVDPRAKKPCERGASPADCVPCAGSVPPRTPWIPVETQWMLFEKRRERLLRELRLARVRLAPSRAHAESVTQYFGPGAAALGFEIVPPLRGPRLARRTPLALPRELGGLRLGSWGHSSAIKGAALVREAVLRASAHGAIELRLAGTHAGEAYRAAELATQPVSDVHALVCGSLAPESYGLVLDEARELGLPALLPRAGAFVERAREGEGVLFYTSGDPDSLASVILRLVREEGLLADLRSRIPVDGAEMEEVLRRTRELHEQAHAAGPPEESVLPREEWFAARLAEAELAHWDEALARTSARALGLEGAP